MTLALQGSKAKTMGLGAILDGLEALHGVQTPPFPTDPYGMLIYANCGYPPSDEACSAGFESLKKEVGLEPRTTLAADPQRLTAAMRHGGIYPDLRAERLMQIARAVVKDFDGDAGGLGSLAPAAARKLFKSLPTIGDPGADKILLFTGMAPVAAVPSNALQVALRMGFGEEARSYASTYRSVQAAVHEALPEDAEALKRAYLLIQRHGRTVCRRGAPECHRCPVQPLCPYGRGHVGTG